MSRVAGRDPASREVMRLPGPVGLVPASSTLLTVALAAGAAAGERVPGAGLAEVAA